MQINFVVNAAAGAQRVFNLMDQTPESDEGYVELVCAREKADGSMEESDRRTNVWAWKHPHKVDGTITYTKLEGSVVLDDVDFGYDEKNWCCTTSAFGPSPARRSPLWAPPAPARPPSPT